MHAPKVTLRAHTYQYTTEIKIQVINKQCTDTMVQFKPGLVISSPKGCTILIDDKTLAIDEFIKWILKSNCFKALKFQWSSFSPQLYLFNLQEEEQSLPIQTTNTSESRAKNKKKLKPYFTTLLPMMPAATWTSTTKLDLDTTTSVPD